MSAEPNNETPMTPHKPFWKSKTLIFNAVCAGLASAELVFPTLRPLIGDTYYPVALLVLTVGNSVLRVYTSIPIVKSKENV